MSQLLIMVDKVNAMLECLCPSAGESQINVDFNVTNMVEIASEFKDLAIRGVLKKEHSILVAQADGGRTFLVRYEEDADIEKADRTYTQYIYEDRLLDLRGRPLIIQSCHGIRHLIQEMRAIYTDYTENVLKSNRRSIKLT